MADIQIQTIRINCRTCKQKTNHSVRARYDDVVSYEFDDSHLYEIKHPYMILQCGGCDTVAFLHIHPVDDEDAIHYVFPDPGKPGDDLNFLSLNEQWKLPDMIRDLYIEVISALMANSSVLAGLGLRTMVEAICIEQAIEGVNLQQKIDNLYAKGLVSSTELPIIHKLRMIGNVSAHEIKGMNMEVLGHAIQIVNHMIKSIYFLPEINKKIQL